MDLPTIAAAVTGAIGSRVLFHPLDTIRTLQQTSIVTGYKLPFAQYWRGLPAAVAFTTPAFTIYLVSYRQAKKELAPYLGHETAINFVASGIIAEIFSSVLWTPMEVVKGNMQLKSEKSGGTIAMIKRMYKTQGIKGFFRGYWMGLAVFTPHSVVWWYTYEQIKRLYKNDQLRVNKPELIVPKTTSPSSVPEETLKLSKSDYAIASAIAGTAAAIVSNFFDVLKTRQQLAIAEEVSRVRPEDKHGLLTVARNLIRESGFVKAMFKGLHVRLMYSLPSSIVSMVIVESLKPE
ncbi:mitochondrial carrier domain-containing protein [Dipodascopsis uninucleata]